MLSVIKEKMQKCGDFACLMDVANEGYEYCEKLALDNENFDYEAIFECYARVNEIFENESRRFD